MREVPEPGRQWTSDEALREKGSSILREEWNRRGNYLASRKHSPASAHLRYGKQAAPNSNLGTNTAGNRVVRKEILIRCPKLCWRRTEGVGEPNITERGGARAGREGTSQTVSGGLWEETGAS